MSSLFSETGEDFFLKIKNIYEELSGITITPASVVYMLISAVAYMILLITKHFNSTYQNLWLKTCDEATTELYANEKDLTREEAVASRMTVNFKRIANIENAQAIPVGTRISYNDFIFYTIATYKYEIGKEIAECIVECSTPGEIGNGIDPGKTFIIIDSIPNTVSCTNTSVSNGGSDQESIDTFKEKIRKFPETYSCAGTKGGYDYWTRKADSLISDVLIENAGGGKTGITILLKGGVIPSDEMIDKVQKFISDPKVRAFNDFIIVNKPEIKEYSIDFDYYIARSRESESKSISIAIETAIKDYVKKTENKLSGSINPDALVNIAVSNGAKRTTFRSPGYYKLNPNQVQKCIDIKCNYLDVEDD